jgi:SMODS-associating 2TM, beta-strand rich effector domain
MPFNAANLVRLLTVVGIIAGATAWLVSDPKWPIEQPRDVIGLARPVSVAATVAVVFWFVLSRWLWRSPLFRGWLVLVPSLNGTWKGELIGNWPDPSSGELHPRLPIKLDVRQTLTSIHCAHNTTGSNNDSLVAGFQISPSGQIHLVYVYASVPRQALDPRSGLHDGACRLQYSHNDGAQKLEGTYWTSRRTTGTISVQRAEKPLQRRSRRVTSS